MEIKNNNQLAIDLLQDAQNKLKPDQSKSFVDEFAQVKRQVQIFADHKLQRNPMGFVIENDAFMLSNIKRRIINGILKPLSHYKKNWDLWHESGFQYTDLYNK